MGKLTSTREDVDTVIWGSSHEMAVGLHSDEAQQLVITTQAQSFYSSVQYLILKSKQRAIDLYLEIKVFLNYFQKASNMKDRDQSKPIEKTHMKWTIRKQKNI